MSSKLLRGTKARNTYCRIDALAGCQCSRPLFALQGLYECKIGKKMFLFLNENFFSKTAAMLCPVLLCSRATVVAVVVIVVLCGLRQECGLHLHELRKLYALHA